MKLKIILIVISFITVALLSGFVFSFLHKVSVKKHAQQSDTKQHSKEDKFYIADFIPNKKTIQLKLRKGTIDLDTAWVEYPWHYEPNNFVTTKEKSMESWYNLCLKFKANKMNCFVWGFEFSDQNIGAIGGYDWLKNQQVSTLNRIPDTLRIFIYEKNLNTCITTDTIIFTKNITSK